MAEVGMVVWTTALTTLMMLGCSLSGLGIAHAKEILHEKAFFSPGFELGPGDVTNSWHNLDFPEGHIAIRNLVAEVVDENEVPVSLTKVYMHHWQILKVFVKEGDKLRAAERAAALGDDRQGTCWDGQDDLWFGLGSETRHTNTSVPSPYGFVTGDADAIPEGYEESWTLNIHAINTIGTEDPVRCLECFCDTYGVTRQEDGRPLPDGYVGGLRCCYDRTRCALKVGVQSEAKTYFLKYTLTWVDWNENVVPLRTYTIDVTDPRTSLTERPICKNEYSVPQCAQRTALSKCVDRRHAIAAIPVGGDVIMSRLHQHIGALGGILYYKDGPVLCSSEPIYGEGAEPGNEAGYLVGMTTCHPEPGTVKADSMRELYFDAYYSNELPHAGVMSHFFLHVADPITRIKEVTDPATI